MHSREFTRYILWRYQKQLERWTRILEATRYTDEEMVYLVRCYDLVAFRLEYLRRGFTTITYFQASLDGLPLREWFERQNRDIPF